MEAKQYMRRYLLLIPGVIFMVQIYWITVNNSQNDTFVVPFDHIPDFTLPSLDIDEVVISEEDVGHQKIRVINFFASWCGPCKVEHPFLLELADEDVDMLGIAFQDGKEQAKQFLIAAENPYLMTALDQNGTLGLDWGIDSIPQTYLLNENGKVIYHKSGRLRREDLDNIVLPLLKRN